MASKPLPELSSAEKQPALTRLGICALDRKARSKPMRNILSRLLATGQFDAIVFGDKVIHDEPIENWPICDFLISFFSQGFPLDKAIAYVKLRAPICINDLPLQKVFWDRRVVLAILDKIGVPTPKRLEASRDGGPAAVLDPNVLELIKSELKLDLTKKVPPVDFDMKGDDTIIVDSRTLDKPFVEKPVSGEDHNVNIYFAKKKGGGARRLFRKVGNKSSEMDPDLVRPRTDASYVYEQFMDVENAEDIKVYTLGPNFAHAETRKSPVVDGLVRRNTEGKEIRFITELSADEKKIANRIATAFKQNICGFDLLRANGKSYVIDVNGWSFVKGNDDYYDKCAEILGKFCQSVPRTPTPGDAESPREQTWKLKSQIAVFRHADRTPKMKAKWSFKCSQEWTKPMVDLLQGRKDEIVLRQTEHLHFIANAADAALKLPGADAEKLQQIKMILEKKIEFAGTKAQIKPTLDAKGDCEKVQLIVKWGGEFTHAARYQSRDLGENLRKDLLIINKELLDHTTIYSSSERRVMATAEVFGGAFLDEKNAKPVAHQLTIRKDLLDDSNAAKEPMDAVKKRLKTLLRDDSYKRPEFAWPVPDVEPAQVVRETMALMRLHRDVLESNWRTLDVDAIQSRWCCGENPFLFRERWSKLFEDFCDVEPEKFDPSRVSELYDSLKFDALHNRVFLERIFSKEAKSDAKAGSPRELKQLYHHAKQLFDLIAPQEYGLNKAEKIEIGLLTSLPLLQKIEADLRHAMNTETGAASYYFTKESHIQTLVNLVVLSELPIVMPVPELDYMAYMAFELYERSAEENSEYSIRISLSEGAHSLPLDSSLDARHALQVQPRRLLTNYIPVDTFMAQYAEKADGVKRSTTAYEGLLPISSGILVEADELYSGGDSPAEQVVSFMPDVPDADKSRPESLASSRAD
ncbi:uncharacterized protein L969DRAFT_97362 [Mixia osmundae IAM 14324]|uniref:Inositol hexakisphosphate and diphosphoinositol-pentakisphosphate kinase n=1 Tax=Mixia osmundae (strain CBS 9802 / IAM 14324 / JCM 22182 / KY 12970) TaxID=764103 RepID=G7DV22_MIXOS|nr:uncharacterized protein L969DRAFT_97362 [Mixia osmundae IAM 14324]KEI36351.1 hypothetical protein L969DRAFT_97362 [Mixia osmundae IAM 14324]GAA94432.1 hypothetical protein E5Q_01084 [Mixia osmundae IAM 14324]